MKTFKKVLASALAAAMVVTAFPVTNAEAASTAKLNKTKATVYAGQSTTLKVTTPKTWKSVKVTASKKGAAAKITKVSGKKVTVKAVKAGTAKVTVKVTAKKAGKKVTKKLTAKITVKNPALTLKAASEVAVGATEQITATVKPANTKVTYTSDNTEVATVDANGVVTGVKAGEATITANAGKTTKTVKMTVKNVILQSVKQTKYNAIEAVITGKTSDIKAQDIVITNKTTNAVVAVKSVSVDEKDASKVTLETYSSVTDGKDYSVTLDGVAKDFTATDATIADVNVSATQITANTTGTAVLAQLLDKNQVVVEEYKINDTLPGKVDYSITSATGYVSDDKIVLPEVGNTATAKITYHTFKYDATGKETDVIEKSFTITAVADATTVSNFNYTITGDNFINWKGTVTKNTSLATNDTKNAYFYFLDSNKADVTANYSVESSDNSVLLLAETSLATNGSAQAVVVTGVNAGNAYINVKKDGKVVTSLPVTVKAARKLSDVKFGKTTLYSSIDSSVSTKDETTVKGYDQYGEEYGISSVTGTILNAPAAETTTVKGSTINLNLSNGVISPVATSLAKGDYLIKVDAVDSSNNTVSRTITLKAVDTAAITASVYELSLSSAAEDLAVASSTTTGKADKIITIQVVEKKGNAPVAVETTSTITVTKPNGSTLATGASYTNTAGVATLKLVEETSGNVTKNFTDLGVYKVHAEYTDSASTPVTHKFDRTFTLTDTQTNAVIDVKKTSNTGVSATGTANATTDAKNVLEAAGVAKFYYDGQEVTVTSGSVTVPTGAAKENGNALYIGKVMVKVTTAGGLTLSVPVNVNRTFILG